MSDSESSSGSETDHHSDPTYNPKDSPRSDDEIWGGGHDGDETETEEERYHDSPGASRKQRSEKDVSDQSYDSAGASDSYTELEDDSVEEISSDNDDSSNVSTDIKSREMPEKRKRPQHKSQQLCTSQPHRQQLQAEPIQAAMPSGMKETLKEFREHPGASKFVEGLSDEKILKILQQSSSDSPSQDENSSTAANIRCIRKQSNSGDSQAVKQHSACESYSSTAFQSSRGISGSFSTKANAPRPPAVSSAQSSRKRRKKEKEVAEAPQEDEAGLTPSKRSRQYKNKVYNRVFLKRDKIIRFLAADVNPGELADKLLVAGLISENVRDKALVTSVPVYDNIRPMIDAVLIRIELNGEIYDKFMDVLREFKSLDDLIQFIEI